jgi:phosphatidylcholine synthase
MTETAPAPAPPWKRLAAYGVHVYTASGLAFAALAMLEVCQPSPDARLVFIWLVIAVAIDATDGFLARRLDVKKNAPTVDGRKIDDIVDFLTFTFIPLVLVARMGWVPDPALLWIGPPLVASVLGFANVGAKDEEGGFFLGFPSYWNILAFYLGMAFHLYGPWPNAIVLLVFTVLTLAPVGFIYPTLAPRALRPVMIIGGVAWVLLGIWALPYFPNPPLWLWLATLVYPVFYTVVSLVAFARHKAAQAG